MKKIAIICAGLCLALTALGQTSESGVSVDGELKVTVTSNGDDVRKVLFQMFSQAKKNFIVETGLYFSLTLNLSNVPFETALGFICKNAGMAYRIENDVYVFHKPEKQPLKTQETKTVSGQTSAPPQNAAPKTLDPSVLNKTINTRLEMADIRDVFREFTKQTGVPIEVDKRVKSLKVNAYMIETSLRFALNSITQTAKLMYTFTDRGTILVSDPALPVEAPPQSVDTKQDVKIACPQCSTELQKGWKYCPSCGNYVKNITT